MEDSRMVLTQYYAAERQSLVEQATRLLHGDVMTAEDIVQTTFLKLLLHFQQRGAVLQTISTTTLPALVQQTMRHLLYDLWRRRQYQHDYELQLSLGQQYATDVFAQCSAAQINELLEQRMARMDDSVAQVMRMNILEEKAVAEISEELGVKYKTVENRLQAGRKQLRNYMKKAV